MLFEYIASQDAYKVSLGTATDTNIIVPATYNNKLVTTVADNGFANDTDLATIIFQGSNIVTLGREAFSGCSLLNQISGLGGITTIPANAFANCVNLTNFEIGNGVLIIGTGAFKNSGIQTVSIPASVVAIEDFAFDGCNITAYVVDTNNNNYASKDGNLYNKNYTELIAYANGQNVTTFSIPTTVQSVSNYAFGVENQTVNLARSQSLKNVIIPTSVTTLYDYSFTNDLILFTYYQDMPTSWQESSIINNIIYWDGAWQEDVSNPVVTLQASAFKTGIYTNWMSYLDPNTRVVDIVMPGSHDSGTNGLGDLYRTQNSGYYDQLIGGTRYFDARIAEYNGVIRSVHADSGAGLNDSNASGVTFESILYDINCFITENPKEIIILDFQHIWNDFSTDVLPMLENSIDSSKILTRTQAPSLSDITIGQMWNWGVNLILIVRDDKSGAPNFDEKLNIYKRSEWLLSPYDGSYHKSSGSELINHFSSYYSQTDSSKVFVLQSQRTGGGLDGLNITNLEKDFRNSANDYATS